MKWVTFVMLLEKQKLSQAAFARLVGINPQIVSRWRHRVKGIPKWAGLVIALRSALARKQRQVALMSARARRSGLYER